MKAFSVDRQSPHAHGHTYGGHTRYQRRAKKRSTSQEIKNRVNYLKIEHLF